MAARPKRPWDTVLIYAWLLGHIVGGFMLKGTFGLIVGAGWLTAMLLWCVKEWVLSRAADPSRRRSWGQATIYTLCLHWVAVVLIVGDLVKAVRGGDAGRIDETDRGR